MKTPNFAILLGNFFATYIAKTAATSTHATTLAPIKHNTTTVTSITTSPNTSNQTIREINSTVATNETFTTPELTRRFERTTIGQFPSTTTAEPSVTGTTVPPPTTRRPPTVDNLITIDFIIHYEMVKPTKQEEHSTQTEEMNLTARLDELYRNKTYGFEKLVLHTFPNCNSSFYLNDKQNCIAVPSTCPNFHFKANGKDCISWWVLLGPLIGVAVVAFFLVGGIIFGVSRRRKPNILQDDKNPRDSSKSENNMVTEESDSKKYNQFENSYQDHQLTYEQEKEVTSETGRQNETTPLRRENLQEFARLSNPTELAQHPVFRNFQPQLDKVDSSVKVEIPRISAKPSKLQRYSLYTYDNPAIGSFNS